LSWFTPDPLVAGLKMLTFKGIGGQWRVNCKGEEKGKKIRKRRKKGKGREGKGRDPRVPSRRRVVSENYDVMTSQWTHKRILIT